VYGSESDDDDVVEHGGAEVPLPGWIRRPGLLPAPGWRPSRVAAMLGIAGLVVGLVAGYVLGYRHQGQAASPSRTTAAGAAPSAVASSAAPPVLNFTGLSGTGLAQTIGACAVQRGREIQVGVEVVNLSETTVILGQVRPILPLGGLRPVSQLWAPCGAISPYGPAGSGTFIAIRASTGQAEPGSTTPGGVMPSGPVLPPNGTAWLSVTFRVMVACPQPLPVQFSISYQENGRPAAAQLPGLPDLGQLTYTGCKGNS